MPLSKPRALGLCCILLLPLLYYWPQDWTARSHLLNNWIASTTSPITAPTATQAPASPTLQPSHTRTLVVPRLEQEDVSWIQQELPGWQTAVYVVDSSSAAFHVPANKGHEAMSYLTYIIDHYTSLPDIVIFTHAGQLAWHNNEMLDGDLAKMLQRLNSNRVVQDGYFNLRCSLSPGCTGGLQLNRSDGQPIQGEDPELELTTKGVWTELHPLDPMPDNLSTPCCGQFAVSRETILNHPPDQYVKWREWLFNTNLTDATSGRVWEFTWHYIFSGKAQVCPEPHICYCDGFGVCFESLAAFNAWHALDRDRIILEEKYKDWKMKQNSTNDDYEQRIKDKQSELDKLRLEAIARGDDPVARARALGS